MICIATRYSKLLRCRAVLLTFLLIAKHDLGVLQLLCCYSLLVSEMHPCACLASWHYDFVSLFQTSCRCSELLVFMLWLPQVILLFPMKRDHFRLGQVPIALIHIPAPGVQASINSRLSQRKPTKQQLFYSLCFQFPLAGTI